MRAISTLFGKSPFAPIQTHMEKVADCVEKLIDIFEAFDKSDPQAIQDIAKTISSLEHQADLTKNDIRNHLPKSLFLPMDRENLLYILSLQDSLADQAEDIGILLALRPIPFPEAIRSDFKAFLEKNLQSFRIAKQIIYELHELLQSSFGGLEAESVKGMVDDVAFKEHEADLIQRNLLKVLLNLENEIPYTVFHIWMRILEGVGNISDLSEKLANCIRMTIETK